jgi:tetratricopeptide (TPR) repeat protein
VSDAVASPPSARAVLITLALVVASIAALLAVDTFLATLDRAARRAEAADLFEQGRRLADAGRHPDAVHRFHAALAIDRGNHEYRLELARAQVAAGRLQAADSTLVGLLQENGTDGEANLALARVLAREDRLEEATAYYHRAIYGLWARDPEANRTRARLELIDLLARRDAKQELLAELLPLEGAGLADTALRRRVGHLFVRAGSPARAAAIFTDLLRRNGRDADGYAGLGEAEFAKGSYRAAAAAFRAALRLQPRNPATARRLALVTQVQSLDPMQRGLSTAERERRSGELLRLSVEAAERCLGAQIPDTVRAALDTAKAALGAKVQASRREEALEANLGLAERLRLLRGDQCPGEPTVPERALDLVLAKLSD